MDTILAWTKTLSPTLSMALNVLIIAVVFLTSFTLLAGIWIGLCIARKRMSHIAEIEFFPPRITFREKTDK